MTQQRKETRFLTVDQVADELGLSTRSVWRLIATKELVPNHFGGAVRISRDELEDYVRRSRDDT